MIHAIVSVSLTLFAAVLLVVALLVPVAVLAGNVIHVWGTTSALEWTSEAFLRVFAGGLRRRFMQTVNRQCHVGVDRSRRACPYIAVSVSPGDVTTLTGSGGSLADVAADAAKGYARYAKTQGWASDSQSQVAVVPEEWLRRGTIKARSVSWDQFVELLREMQESDGAATALEDTSRPPANPTSREAHQAPQFSTTRLPDGEALAAAADDVLTAVLDSAHAVTVAARSARIVLADTEGLRHDITSDSVLIGRGRGCGLTLNSPEVSREHVNVYFQEGSWWLRDRGSRNGTTVDGHAVRGTGPVRLRLGSQIVLGEGKAAAKLTIASLEEH